MKYSKKATYDYNTNGINEENGWVKWYSKEKVGKKLRLTATYTQVFMICAVIAVSRHFTDAFKAVGISEIILYLIINAVILLFAVAPIREILHLLSVSKGRLDEKCIISFKNNFSVYNGSVNRKQIIISLVLPVIFFASVFGVSAVLTSGITRVLAIFLLIESCFICCSDIYMLFFVIMNIAKDETIFGEYKK